MEITVAKNLVSVTNVIKYIGWERYCEQRRFVKIWFFDKELKEAQHITGVLLGLTPQTLIVRKTGSENESLDLYLDLNTIMDLVLVN